MFFDILSECIQVQTEYNVPIGEGRTAGEDKKWQKTARDQYVVRQSEN